MKRYLEDVEPGDILYNFLEGNKEYTVNEVRGEEGLDYPIIVAGDTRVVRITLWGTEILREKVPYFLYAPVDVLDPRNLPPRPWRPRKGEWVWARGKEWRTWALRRFKGMDKEGVYVCTNVYDSGTELFYEVAPFKGELPPGLEEEDTKYLGAMRGRKRDERLNEDR